MTYLAVFLVGFCFATSIRLLGFASLAVNALETARAAARVVRDSSLSDESKARAARQASLALMRQFLSLSGRGVVAAGISLLPLAALAAAGLASWSAVAQALGTWQGIALASAAALLAASVRFRA